MIFWMSKNCCTSMQRIIRSATAHINDNSSTKSVVIFVRWFWLWHFFLSLLSAHSVLFSFAYAWVCAQYTHAPLCKHSHRMVYAVYNGYVCVCICFGCMIRPYISTYQYRMHVRFCLTLTALIRFGQFDLYFFFGFVIYLQLSALATV